MNLNCRPGDLAILIRDVIFYHGNEPAIAIKQGKVVRVVKLAGAAPPGFFISDVDDLPCWELEEPIPVTVRFSCGCFVEGEVVNLADRVLKPLRDTDGVDETLRNKELEML